MSCVQPIYNDLIFEGGAQLLKARLPNLPQDPDPADLYPGMIWYNTTEDLVKFYNGSDVEYFVTSDGQGSSPTGIRFWGPLDIPADGAPVGPQYGPGDFFVVTVGGGFGGVTAQPGDLMFVNTDNPTGAPGDYFVVETSSGQPGVADHFSWEVGAMTIPAGTTSIPVPPASQIISAEVFSADGQRITPGLVIYRKPPSGTDPAMVEICTLVPIPGATVSIQYLP